MNIYKILNPFLEYHFEIFIIVVLLLIIFWKMFNLNNNISNRFILQKVHFILFYGIKLYLKTSADCMKYFNLYIYYIYAHTDFVNVFYWKKFFYYFNYYSFVHFLLFYNKYIYFCETIIVLLRITLKEVYY